MHAGGGVDVLAGFGRPLMARPLMGRPPMARQWPADGPLMARSLVGPYVSRGTILNKPRRQALTP